jgi:hypothetical protein
VKGDTRANVYIPYNTERLKAQAETQGFAFRVGEDKKHDSFPVLPRHPREMAVGPRYKLISSVSTHEFREILIEVFEVETTQTRPIFG